MNIERIQEHFNDQLTEEQLVETHSLLNNKVLDKYLLMKKLNVVLKMHGVVCVVAKNDMHSFFYLNTGDSYGATVVYFRYGKRFLLTTWGDIVEHHPNRYE